MSVKDRRQMGRQGVDALRDIPAGTLSRLFSTRLLKDLSLSTGGRIFANVVQGSIIDRLSSKTTVSELYSSAFEALVRSDRSEYVYKNAIARKLLLGRHSVNTTALFFEFPAGKSKLDALFLNGSSHAYEIKTSQDELRRLDTQIPDYQKRFQHVWVLTSYKHAERAAASLPREIGLAVLTARYSIRVIRPATKRVKYLDSEAMLSSMRRSEYLNVLAEIGKSRVPEGLPNTEIYSFARREFASMDPVKIHNAMVYQLRGRFESRKALVALSLPHALTAAGLGLELSETQLKRLLTRLSQSVFSLGDI